MSLRDELAEALCELLESHPSHAPRTPCQERAKKITPIIERAIAAERAAMVQSCLLAVRREPVWVPPDHESTPCEAARTLRSDEFRSAVLDRIASLPYDRSALDDALAQARREQREKDATLVENYRMADHILENYDLSRVAAAILAPAAPVAPVRQRASAASRRIDAPPAKVQV